MISQRVEMFVRSLLQNPAFMIKQSTDDYVICIIDVAIKIDQELANRELESLQKDSDGW